MSQTLRDGAQEFIELALGCGALAFGDFTLKSGRPSPYFLNVGKIAGAGAMARLSKLYADMAEKTAPSATLLGVPYKGISLAAVTCAELGRRGGAEGRHSFAYLRKEKKDHGEKGLLVGDVKKDATLWLVDDVLTAGTAVRQALEVLAGLGLKAEGLMVTFDRMERAQDGDKRLASQVLAEDHGLKVSAIATAKDMMEKTDEANSKKVRDHLERYGAVR